MMIRRRTFLGGLSALGIASATRAKGAINHDELFRAGLVLPPGPAGRCDDDRIGGPVVRWDPQQRDWRMWHYGRHRGFPAELAPAFGTGSIAMARSDDGVNWSRVDGPLAGGAVLVPSAEPNAFDTVHLGTGDVIRHNDHWLMAYFGGNQETPTNTPPTYQHPGYVLRPGIARSTDGLNWRRIAGDASGNAALDVDPGDVYAGFPTMIHDGERFLMYFTSVDKRGRYWRTHMAQSADAVHWTKIDDLHWDEEPALFEAGGVVTRDIQPNPFADDSWLMVYTAKDGRTEAGGRRSIGVAISDDLLNWRKLLPQPIFTVGREGAWDHAGVANPRLIVTEDEVRLYYYGWSDSTFDGHPQRGIGCAVARREDPWRFLRYIA